MTWCILAGDCREALATLPAESVQCVVTSPPYWGLRDYGAKGQIGLERSPTEYVDQLRQAFREVHRVLRPDGTLWLNLGDCYSDGGGGKQGATGQRAARRDPGRPARKRICRSGLDGGGTSQAHVLRADEAGRRAGLKPKELVGIPWRVAFALQSDGWWLRQEVIWHKPNPMPESVTDRPTRAHEQIFLLTRSASYYYDAVSAAEPAVSTHAGGNGFTGRQGGTVRAGGRSGGPGSVAPWNGIGGTRNRRSVWTVPTCPFPGAHFATFPPRLVEPCVLAGSRPGDLVLDPFAGTGTVGLVASRLGRDFIGIEINAEYSAMARDRFAADAPLLNRLESP